MRIGNSRHWVLVLFIAMSSCRTTSEPEARVEAVNVDNVGQLSEKQWVDACQKELENPKTQEQARQDLEKLSGSTDCRVAYQVVKQVIDAYKTPR